MKVRLQQKLPDKQDFKTQEKLTTMQKELSAALEALQKIRREKVTESNGPPENVELKNAVKTVLYTTFVVIERELILSRISNIAGMYSNKIVVKCTSCSKQKAVIECKQSHELVCKECYFTVQSKLNYADEIDLLPYIGGDEEIDDQVLKEVEKNKKSREKSSNKTESPAMKWRKFEYFSFPTNQNSQTYQELNRIFKVLYSIYITESGIDRENKIVNSKKFLRIKVTDDFSDETSESKSPLPLITTDGSSSRRELWVRSPSEKSVFKGEIDRDIPKMIAKYTENRVFNDEEKLFLNRVGFLLFKRNGASTTFTDFLRVMKSLQV